MTDEGPRPGWPGSGPQPPEPQPEAHEGAARPSWDRVTAAARRTVDIKLVIAVLIGLVSVTGAAMAWKSSISGEHATDKDRQAVAETVIIEQTAANNEVIVQDARARFAQHAIAVLEADRLAAQADEAEGGGDDDLAAELRDAATELRVVGRRALEGTLGPVLLSDYVDQPAAGVRPVFEEDRLARDLALIAAAQNKIDAGQTIRDANRLRDESERLDRWIIFMVAAVVLLTLAQINGHKLLRFGLTGLGTSVWIVSAVLAWTGN